MATVAADLRLGEAGQGVGRHADGEASPRLAHPSSADLRHIGGRRGLPLVGAMPEILLDPAAFAERMVARHGPMYKFHALGRWHVHVAGPEAMERLLFDAERRFSAGEGWGPLVAPLLPGALLLRDGQAHRDRRRLMGEAFRHSALQGYQQAFSQLVEARVTGWMGRRIDVFQESRRLTLDLAVLAFLGMSLGEEGDRAMAAFGRIAGGLLAMSYNPWLSPARWRGLRAKRALERFLEPLVLAKRRAPGADFLSQIAVLRDREGALLPHQEICDMFIFLLVAAHDTMSSTLSTILYFLAREPGWAERLREAGPAGLDQMFFKECVRLHPPAPVVWRRALADVEFHGRRVPAGTMVGANLLATHRLPDLWPDPHLFDPSRFSPEAEKARHRFAFVPFGGGIHKCLGMHLAQAQAAILVAELVGRCRLALAGERPPSFYAWPSYRPRGRLLIEVRPRSPGS